MPDLQTEQANLANEDVTESEIAEMLEYPSDFGYSGDKDIGGTWSLGPVVLTRDSDILTEANYKALMIALEADTKSGLISEDDYVLTSCSHWACGWVEQLSFLAVDKDGDPTMMCRWVMRWVNMLKEYPVANEELYYEMEWAAGLVTLKEDILGHEVKLTQVDGQLPDDYADQIHGELNEGIREGDAWPVDEVKDIALAFGWLACEECEGEGWYMNPDDGFTKPWGGEQNKARKLTCKECKGTGAQKKVEA